MTHCFKRATLLSLFLLLAVWPRLHAQSSMTDEQIMEFVITENAKGTSQQQIVTRLMQRGVDIQQIRRIREKYEKEQKGDILGAKDVTGKSTSEKRLRKNNGDERDDKLKNSENYRRRVIQEKEDEPIMSERRRRLLQQRKEDDYVEGLDFVLMDSLKRFDEIMAEGEEEEGIKVFGRNIFNQKLLTFEPNMNIATPSDYRLGPGDAVFVDIWGASQKTITSTVSPEGAIDIEGFGPVQVSGMTVDEANAHLKSTLGKRFVNSEVRLTVGQTRTITVNVMGEVEAPGTYTLSAFVFTHDTLVQNTDVFQDVGFSPYIAVVGIFIVGFSSALGSFIGGARVLQALARDRVFSFLGCFGKGYGKGDEPRIAILLMFSFCFVCLFIGGLEVGMEGSCEVDHRAHYDQFLLFVVRAGESLRVRSPHHRGAELPTSLQAVLLAGFALRRAAELHHHVLHQLGVRASALLHPPSKALISVLVMVAIFIYLLYTTPRQEWGDISQSLIFHQARKMLLKLDLDKNHPKYWRPSILLYAPTPETFPLIDFCNVLKKGGLYVVGTVYQKDLTQENDEFYTLENFWSFFIGHVQAVFAFSRVVQRQSLLHGELRSLRGRRTA